MCSWPDLWKIYKLKPTASISYMLYLSTCMVECLSKQTGLAYLSEN